MFIMGSPNMPNTDKMGMRMPWMMKSALWKMVEMWSWWSCWIIHWILVKFPSGMSITFAAIASASIHWWILVKFSIFMTSTSHDSASMLPS